MCEGRNRLSCRRTDAENIYVTHNDRMPIPLSLAFSAMREAKRFHTAPVFARPFRLRTVYFARIGAYVATGAFVLMGQNEARTVGSASTGTAV